MTPTRTMRARRTPVGDAVEDDARGRTDDVEAVDARGTADDGREGRGAAAGAKDDGRGGEDGRRR